MWVVRIYARGSKEKQTAFMQEQAAKIRIEQLREILDAERADRSKGWLMQTDGTYVLDPGEEDSSSQERLYNYFHGKTVNLPPPVKKKKTFIRRLFRR